MAPRKSAPDTVTVPPPAVGPLCGSTARTWGDTKVYSPIGTAALVPAPAPAVVMVTASWAAERTSGVVTVTEVGVC